MGIIRRNGPDKENLLRRAHLGKVENAAEMIDLAKAHNLKLAPLDIQKLAELLGLKISMEALDNSISGSLKFDDIDEKWCITVNSLHHPTRQRFTIAHEIGHFILHRAQAVQFVDKEIFRDGNSNVCEMEANQFAAELLMPDFLFYSFIETHSRDIDSIASFFEVSPLAVEIRVKQLGSGN